MWSNAQWQTITPEAGFTNSQSAALMLRPGGLSLRGVLVGTIPSNAVVTAAILPPEASPPTVRGWASSAFGGEGVVMVRLDTAGRLQLRALAGAPPHAFIDKDLTF